MSRLRKAAKPLKTVKPVDALIKDVPPAHHPAGFKLARIWYRRLRERLLTLLLAMQVFTLFIMPAMRSAGAPISHSILISVLLVFVALAILLSRSRGAIITMILSVALSIAGGVWHHEQPDLLTDSVNVTGQVLAQLSLLWVVSTAVFGPGRFTYHRILGAVVMYLATGMIFTSLDIFVARTFADSYTHVPMAGFELREAMTYFSFSTLTTASFGDIAPVHTVARSLANLESICGQLFPATLLARIVSLHGSHKSANYDE